MSRVTKQELMPELRLFAHRKLNKGELVLLAYAIANRLPLLSDKTSPIGVEMVKHLPLIEQVVYTLQEHAGFEGDGVEAIKNLVARFLLWRTEVASGGMVILFSGEHNTVIDDMSGLLRFVDVSVLCSVGDSANKANWLMKTFSDLTIFCQDRLIDLGE